MARGDGELLSGLGNLIGAVTGTIEKKNDQEFQLRREDTLTRLQTERDNMLMQTQALLSERENMRRDLTQVQTNAATLGVRVNRLHDTGGLGSVLNMTGKSLQENIDALGNQAAMFQGNIKEYNDAIAGFVEGSKGFAIATKKWEGLFQGDGVITDEEGRQLYQEVYGTDPDDPNEQYRFQGFIQTARNKELYDRARLTESSLLSEETKRREMEANIAKAEYELNNVLPMQRKQLEASIANANMNTMNAAIEISTKLREQSETQAATVFDRISGDFFNRAQALLNQEGISPEQAQTNVNNLMTREFFTEGGSYYNGTQTAIQMSVDQKVVAEMLNGDDFQKFLQQVNARHGRSVAQSALVQAEHNRGGSQGYSVESSVDYISDMFTTDTPDGLQPDGGAAMKKMAMAYLYWKQTGRISNDGNVLNDNYSKYVADAGKRVADEMMSGLRKITANPTSMVQYIEGFTRSMHDTKGGANHMDKAIDMLYQQYTRRVMEVNIDQGGGIPVLSKEQFSRRFDSHRAFANIAANKQTVDPSATSVMNLLATSGLLGSVDMANPGYSETALNMYTLLELGGNMKMAAADPSVLYEIANTTGSIGLQQLREQSAFVDDGIPRSSFFESFQRLMRATSSMNESAVGSGTTDKSYIMAPVRNRRDAAQRELNEAWKAFGGIK